MSADNGTRIKVDAAALTLLEHAEAAEAAAPYADHPGAQFYVVAAMAWVTKRRTDPTFTYDQALALQMGDMEIVGDEAAPEAPGANYGAPPQTSPVSGT